MRPMESFVEQPVRSLQTMLRVLAEDDYRLPTVVPDGIYGPLTMNAVTAFQRKQQLPVTGIADEETWNAIAAAYELASVRVGPAESVRFIMNPSQVYRLGESDPNIYVLQAVLTVLSNDNAGIPTPGNSGVFDEATSSSVSGFQRLSGLPETGELDKITWKHIARQHALSIHRSTGRGTY